MNTTETELLVNLDNLPGGPECRIQVVASAGLRTTLGESDRFAVAVRPRSLFIHSPAEGVRYQTGYPISCAAGAYSPDFGVACADEIYWTSPQVGFLGTGSALTIGALPTGKHRIAVHAPDGLGKVISKDIGIIVEEACCDHCKSS